jgi:hypothetical protein
MNSDEALIAIIQAIFDSGEMEEGTEGHSWSEFSLVMEFRDDGSVSGTYGYAYTQTGEWYAIAVKPRLLSASIKDYLTEILRPGDSYPVKLLLQFNRDTSRFKTEFEYEDSSRWQVTPANLNKVIQELRPNLK